MVKISHSGVNDNKVNEILKAAQKRFGLFGYGKTAMYEIADDLGISKASLYYYFPDKESLFRAVFEKEQQEFIRELHQIIDNCEDAEALIKAFIRLRMTSFRSFINLGRVSFNEIKEIKNIVKDSLNHLIDKEKEEIKRIFEKGIHQGLFDIQNKDELALLFIEILRGLSRVHIRNIDISQLNEEDFAALDKKIMQFTTIFIKGISVHNKF
jgi:TetR/AcrR family transcriptional regulator